ncbi:peptide ABC transporter substrate-binding protein [Vallitalea sp.]|jgi:oligopeptide transport system substrate-binding protein|uniref:peptide ABC transporter substrate-binding protein n=1 Tax=Vallitalea sp. TaxID=1882829 RepID=UPI0025EFA7CE|nr:peptide ABC transporter substrate-binding protein [Vallitalea sp.]MCT4685869.1 peptide ABC transporter substrate-binding protein [Vallitalea sp.]
MKKLLALLLVLTMTFSLAACGNKDKDKTPSDNKTVSENETDKDKDKDKDTEESDKKEKVLNLLEITNIPSLVTWKATDQVSFQVLGNIVSGLYILGLDGTPQPELAKSYEVSPDGLTYTFHLREGIKWATVDGEEYDEVTANDFIFAWKKLLDPKEAAQYAVMLKTASIKNGADAVDLNNDIVIHEQTLKDLEGLSVDNYEDTEEASAQKQYDEAKVELEEKITKQKAKIEENYGTLDEAKEKLNKLIDNLAVTAVDKYTLKIELDNPVPYFLDLMTFASFFPVSEKFYNEVGADNYGKTVDKFLYNGAYIFKEWKLSERHYFVKNPIYWDVANVDINALDYRVIEGPNNDTVVQMYLDGELDSAGLAGENVEKYGTRPDTVQLGETTVFYLDLNLNNGALTPTKKVLRDPRARKAINMAIDKSYITDVVLGNGSIPIDFFLPKGFVSSAAHDGKGFRQVAEDLYGGGEGYNKYNPEKAKELWNTVLEEQAIDKLTLECIISTSESSAKMGTHIKDELEKNLPGATVELVILPFAERLKRTTNGDFSMSVGGWGPDYPDAMTFMDMWVTGGAYNRGHFSSEAYDEGIEITKSGELTAPDKSKERFEKLVELEKVLLEDNQVIAPLFQRNRLALRNPKIKDLTLQQFGADYIYKWAKLED